MGVSEVSLQDRVQRVHAMGPVIDNLGGYGFCYEEILAGGINATNVSISMYPSQHWDWMMSQLRRYYGLIEMDPARLMLVEEAADILRAKGQGKLGLIIGLQNAGAIGDDVTLLPILHKLGVRVIQITYNEANLFGYGCMEKNDLGLTNLGVQLVQSCNRLGILVDLSHVGWQTSRDAIEESEDPVAFTHSNPWELKKSPRNRPDDLIKACVAKGGMIGATPFAVFCKSAPGVRPTLADFLDQVEYLVDLVGIDNVGIATDRFEGKTAEEYFLENRGRYPRMMGARFDERHVEGFATIRDFPRITEGLLARGYSDEDCAKLIGGNFYRLYERVWKKMPF